MDKRTKVLVVFAALMAMCLLASNLMATKLWDMFGIPVDGGLLLYPLSYLVGDMLVEFFGKKTANQVAVISMLTTIIAVLMLYTVGLLPAYPGWTDQAAYMTIFGFSVRVTVASLSAFLISQMVNNLVFVRIAEKNGRYETRAFLSSIVGRLFDCLVFETMAFLGVLPFSEFLTQAVGAYFEGAAVELILVMTVSGPITRKIHHYISLD